MAILSLTLVMFLLSINGIKTQDINKCEDQEMTICNGASCTKEFILSKEQMEDLENNQEFREFIWSHMKRKKEPKKRILYEVPNDLCGECQSLGPDDQSPIVGSTRRWKLATLKQLPSDSNKNLTIFCDCTRNTQRYKSVVVLRRVDNSTNFNRTFEEYEKGFGNITGNYWIGLIALHSFTPSPESKRQLIIDYKLATEDDDDALPLISTMGGVNFGAPETNYTLKVAAADGELSFQKGGQFLIISGNKFCNGTSGWWFNLDEDTCSLNGPYEDGGVEWLFGDRTARNKMVEIRLN